MRTHRIEAIALHRIAIPAIMSILSLDADENPSLHADSSVPQTITLISKEGRRLQVARQALMASELCKTTLEGGQSNARTEMRGMQSLGCEGLHHWPDLHPLLPLIRRRCLPPFRPPPAHLRQGCE